ncbi:transmembrane protein, putative [Medicago truncatula]|uniref:Transmembrane protein, putative n=1 Tax=Medicago truncatula TaxID=3880 RepID=G7IR84_MEDTR|nr:transmembrane protein, putative [Medicago truncatula]
MAMAEKNLNYNNNISGSLSPSSFLFVFLLLLVCVSLSSHLEPRKGFQEKRVSREEVGFSEEEIGKN